MASRWLRAPVLAVMLLFPLATPALGARNTLSNPTASPPRGTTATTFTFTVRYEGAPASVTFSIADRTVRMTVISGTSSNGTFGGSTTLPVGSWQVTFKAVAQRNDDRLPGPTVTVMSTATPRPTTAPAPPPTPIPTTPPPPITATPLAPTPLPSATPGLVGGGNPDASGFIGGFILTPVPTSTPDAAPALEEPGVGDEIWTLVTGGLIAVSILALLGMVGILRSHRPEPFDQPIGPADNRPPTSDE
jgi:hypothetical protein